MEDAGRVLGVSLVSELRVLSSSPKKSEQPAWSGEHVLGVVIANPEALTIRELRQLLSQQLESAPASFRFVTRQGWPVSSRQEPLIKAVHVVDSCNVVRIERLFAQSRVGVLTEDGRSVGFLFVDLTATVVQLRAAMKKQISYVSKLSEEPTILDRNGWPIGNDQESQLTVVDVLVGQTMRIRDTSVSKSNWVPAIVNPHIHPGSNRPSRMQSLLEEVESIAHPGSGRQEAAVDPVLMREVAMGKEVLISYVRKEAAKHARDLKDALLEQGLSVYLDVHEIKCGVDWQDSLNDGIAGCDVFVPLLTPSYGETQWTNREVKLADVLGKFIVPVNFLGDWPPRCLAIQFATTQFIPWKLPEDAAAGDLHVWDQASIRRVAKAIAEKLITERAGSNRSTEREVTLKSYASIKKLPSSVAVRMSLKESRTGKPLIVVCCHVDQSPFIHCLQTLLRGCGYDVWSTERLSVHEQEQLNDQQQNSSGRLKPQRSVSFSDEDGKQFAERVDEANCVVLVLSAAFAKSLACQQQVFYCEHRKRLVKVQYEKFAVPPWLSMLIGTRAMIDGQASDYETVLKGHVKLALDPTVDPDAEDAADEELISRDIERLKSMLPESNMVYISGGIDFYNPKSKEICKAIGTALARNELLNLVTGGFYGVGETVGKSFFAERERLKLPGGVYHVLPVKEKKDFSAKAVQNPDGSFAKLSYGDTVFCGQSVRQRETLVSRVLTISIIVEGGPGAAHEAEEFQWNDHTVVPVRVTGGAAGGNFGVPLTIFQIPPGVSASDWSQLSNEDASPEEIGSATERIIQSLLSLDVAVNGQTYTALSPASTVSMASTQDV